MTDAEYAKEAVRYLLFESTGPYELGDIIANVMDPDESDAYDDDEWDILIESVYAHFQTLRTKAWAAL